MIHSLALLLRAQLASNQFLAGGALLGIVAGFVAALRRMPARLWRALMRQIFIEVVVEDRDEAFLWVAHWLAAQPYGQKRSRSLMVLTEKTGHRDSDDGNAPVAGGDIEPPKPPKVIFTPARGSHWFIYRHRLVILHRGKDEEPVGARPAANGDLSKLLTPPEVIRISVLARKRTFAMQLIDDARELAHPPGERSTGIITTDSWAQCWRRVSKRRPRPLESVMLKVGMMESCIAEIQKFLGREMWYADHGIPYRLGIEFEGPPGSGKSSTVAAIAAHFGMDVAVLNLSSSNLDDDKLSNLLADAPRSAILLIEDIDCIPVTRDKTSDQNKLTFSGLLNAIDGVSAGEGRILFVTTNRHGVLDPALVRPGRIDLRYEIGAPDGDQVMRLFLRFFPEASDVQGLRFVRSLGDLSQTSMAEIQGRLLKASGPESAIPDDAPDWSPASHFSNGANE